MNKYFNPKDYEIRVCEYPEEKRISLRMKKYEVYKLLGTHWEYQTAFDTRKEAQEYINSFNIKY